MLQENKKRLQPNNNWLGETTCLACQNVLRSKYGIWVTVILPWKIDGGGMTHRTIPQHGYLIQLLTMEQIWFFLKIVYPKPTSCIICSLLKWSIYSMALRHMLTLSTLGVCRCLWLGRMCCSRIWRFSIWPCSLQPFGGQFPQSERGIQW